MKIKKTKKSVKQRGNTTHGHGARKKWKKSGHKGGVGMAGSGKRGDQKKTLIIKKYGNKYFGKQGVTSRRSAKKRMKVINIGKIERDYGSLMKKFGKSGVLEMSDYKLLGNGEIGRGIKLKVKEVSSGAVEKIKKAGGSVEVLKVKKDKDGEVSSALTTPKSNDENSNNLKQDRENKSIKEENSSVKDNIKEEVEESK